jgi:hypothetical protein
MTIVSLTLNTFQGWEVWYPVPVILGSGQHSAGPSDWVPLLATHDEGNSKVVVEGSHFS